MGLYPCSSCGHPISDRAAACPKCGARIAPSQSAAPAREATPTPTKLTPVRSKRTPLLLRRIGCVPAALALVVTLILVFYIDTRLNPTAPSASLPQAEADAPEPPADDTTPTLSAADSDASGQLAASAPEREPEVESMSEPAAAAIVPVNPSRWTAGSPERRVADWFAAYARSDWHAMTAMRLPSQDDREMAYNWIEGTYFFREYRELESLRVLSRNDVSAEVRATWRHDMGRSHVDLILIRENARGNPTPFAAWSISHTSAVGVRDLD